MVADTGATPCSGGIRPLDAPQLVQVDLGEDDMPAAIGTARNRNARVLVHRGSTGSPRTAGSSRTELKSWPPFATSASSVQALSSSKEGRQTFTYEWRKILEVLDTWRIEDEWWRKQPVSRLYYRVVLEDGTMVGLFKDLVSGDWYSQRG